MNGQCFSKIVNKILFERNTGERKILTADNLANEFKSQSLITPWWSATIGEIILATPRS